MSDYLQIITEAYVGIVLKLTTCLSNMSINPQIEIRRNGDAFAATVRPILLGTVPSKLKYVSDAVERAISSVTVRPKNIKSTVITFMKSEKGVFPA